LNFKDNAACFTVVKKGAMAGKFRWNGIFAEAPFLYASGRQFK